MAQESDRAVKIWNIRCMQREEEDARGGMALILQSRTGIDWQSKLMPARHRVVPRGHGPDYFEKPCE